MPCCKCEEFKWEDPQDPIYTDENGKEYCLFHAPAEHKGMSGEDFNDQVFGRIDAVKKRINAGDEKAVCDLSGTIFPDDISFSAYDEHNPLPGINLNNASFGGYAGFNEASFGGDAGFNEASFGGNAEFIEASFGGYAGFIEASFGRYAGFNKASFGGTARFNKASFGGDAGFNEASFGGDARFNKASFGGYAGFIEASFGGYAWFEKASFGGDAIFDMTTMYEASFAKSEFKSLLSMRGFRSDKALFSKVSFHQNADFTASMIFAQNDFNDAHFQGGAYFNNAILGGKTSFERTRFNDYLSFDRTRIYGKSFFKRTYFKEAVHFGRAIFLRRAAFEACSAKEKITMDRVDMKNVRLFNSPLESISFISCTWPKDEKNRDVVADSDIYKKKSGLLEDIYRRLKRKAKEDNDELMASSWHFMEKEMTRERLGGIQDKTKKGKFLCLALCIYRNISGYGEEPLRAFGCLFLFSVLSFLTFSGLKLIETGLSWHFSPTAAKQVFVDFMNSLPLIRISPRDGVDVLRTGFCWFWQAIITIQFAIFAFALRNKLRR